MTTQAMGTIIDGALKLDRPLALPDHSRVRVSIEPIQSRQARFQAGLEQWKAYCEQRPIHSGGRRPTRDELHERR